MPNSPTRHLPDVYPFIAYLGTRFGCSHVLAVGETAAQNLIDFHPEFEVIGVVKGANLPRYRQQYPFGTWLDLDETSSGRNPVAENILEHAVIFALTPLINFNDHRSIEDLKELGRSCAGLYFDPR